MSSNTNTDLVGFLQGSSSGATDNEKSALDRVLEGSADFGNKLKGDAIKAQQEVEKRKAAEEEAKAKAEEEAYKKKLASLETNQILLTGITGGALPTSGIDHVIDTYPEDHWDEEYRVDIPSVDPEYVWDAEVLEQMILCVKLREKGLLVGFPGTGKTTAVKQFAAHLKQPFARFNGKGGIEPSAFLGSPWASWEKVTMKDGREELAQVMDFREGLMPIAVREGYLVCMDEVFKLTPDIQMALQSLYEKDGFLMLDEKPGTIEDKHVHAHEDFKMFCTDNTAGLGDNLDLFASGQMQDTSTLDRFGMTIRVNYLPRDTEVDMLQGKYPEVDRVDLKKLVIFAELVRTSYKDGNLPVTLSPRGLSTMCGLIDMGIKREQAITMVFINKLTEDVHINTAQEQLRTV